MSLPGAVDVTTRLEPREAAPAVATPTAAATAPKPVPAPAAASAANARDDFFIPDFCAPRMVFVLVLVAELVAVTLSLARPSTAFLPDLARVSLFLQWLALTSAALLCYARPVLVRLGVGRATAAVFALLALNTGVLSEAALFLSRELEGGSFGESWFPPGHWSFLLRNEGITAIVTALLLRYFFVSHAWQRHVQGEARSRIEALQARIRPHFLFNSLNTIASLTRTAPRRAEEAVEDLADLFRATLRESPVLRLKEELELSRVYQRIEALRLGDRLEVRWDVAELPMRALVPSLTLQPLLENAIYHGIEPLGAGGTVTVSGRVRDGRLEIAVANPVADAGTAGPERRGNRLAIDNIRQRLALAYGTQADLSIEQTPGEYRVTIRFPYQE